MSDSAEARQLRRRPRPLVRIRNLSKHYVRGDQDVPVLTDISLDIPAGDFLALMGRRLRQNQRC